jgi:GDP-mannose 4,6-dehydratase
MEGSRVLITGLTGFVGSHLAAHIRKHWPTAKVVGLKRWRSPMDNVQHLLGDRNVSFVDGDLTDEASMRRVVREADADFIFHLAAQSYVPYSYRAPRATLEANVIGTANLLEAVRLHRDGGGKDPWVHVCSSSEVYGQPAPDEVPIRESQPLCPISPYGVSKVAEDLLGLQYWIAYRIKAIRTRMFTHTGPRRGDVFVEAAFTKQAVEVEKGLRKVIYVGNLDSVRTFADVRDAVDAYCLLLLKCGPGEVYNIGGNRTMTIGEMLDLVIARAKLRKRPRIQVDPALLRPADVTLQVPDCTKFIRATGWKPRLPFERTIDDMLAHYRERIR